MNRKKNTLLGYFDEFYNLGLRPPCYAGWILKRTNPIPKNLSSTKWPVAKCYALWLNYLGGYMVWGPICLLFFQDVPLIFNIVVWCVNLEFASLVSCELFITSWENSPIIWRTQLIFKERWSFKQFSFLRCVLLLCTLIHTTREVYN